MSRDEALGRHAFRPTLMDAEAAPGSLEAAVSARRGIRIDLTPPSEERFEPTYTRVELSARTCTKTIFGRNCADPARALDAIFERASLFHAIGFTARDHGIAGATALVRVLGVERTADTVTLRMERVGEQVQDIGILAVSSVASAPDYARLLGEALEGLSVLHRQGFVHDNLKPSNILVAPDGHVRVADPSVGFLAAPGTFAFDRMLRYCAPERARGLAATARSDLYMLAMAFLDVMVGERVLDEALRIPGPPPGVASASPDLLAWTQELAPVNVRGLLPAMPGRLVRALQSCLIPEPERRCESAQGVMDMLSDAAIAPVRGTEAALPAEAPPAEATSPRSETPRWLGLLVAYAAGLGTAALLRLRVG